MKLFDYLALAGAVFLTVLALVSALSAGEESLEISIQSEGKEWLYPLDASTSQSFSGPVGKTVVEIGNGQVFVSESDCKEQICVQSGSIHDYGQWIACLPNRVFIAIRGKQEGEVDGQVY